MQPDETWQNYSGQPLSRQLLLDLLKEYKRPQDKISEMVRQKILTPVKRGLFIPGPATRLEQPEPFLLANHLYGPSYVSMETALSHWRLIPEKVYEIASMTTRRSAEYDTKAGRFTYRHLPLPYYAFGQQPLRLSEKQGALIAGPEKALCDKMIATSGLLFRSEGALRSWLTEDMRMDRDSLRSLRPGMIRSWAKDAPKQLSILLLANTLEDL
jgi:hypothetical protein